MGKNKRNNSHKNHVFQLTAPAAKSVLLVGDFTRWVQQGIPMAMDRSGVWTATVPLPAGNYRYRFIVDGEWQNDPECRFRVANPFGGEDMIREAA